MSRLRSALASTAVALSIGAPLLLLPAAAPAQINIGVSINVGFPPPPLPIYQQPVIPAYGYIWVPGYWAWDDNIADYYWVPGTWVQPPRVGLLWTPAWWGFNNGRYGFNPGYWGPHVGFYGGINYGYGYTGNGYEGGRWQGNNFYYNNTVNNISNVHITNVYRQTVVTNTTLNHVSYNGGQGGVPVRPTPEQLQFAHQPHVAPTQTQVQHIQLAKSDPELRASVNHGRPAIAATPRPAVFKGPGVVTNAKAVAPYRPPAGATRPVTAPNGFSSGDPAHRLCP